jgi:dihydroorotate dehydrogenase (NAD+) catalytic subunit
MVRSCVEGPVFAGDRVRWDDVGSVPADAWARRRAATGDRRRPDAARRAVDMTTRIAGVEFANPVFTASAARRPGASWTSSSTSRCSAAWSPSRSCWRASGRATPRMAETPSGMLNSIGLQGPGIDAFLEHDLAWLETRGARAVVSIAGGSVEDYAVLAAAAERLAGRGDGRGQHLLPERRGPRPGVRLRPRGRRRRRQAVRFHTPPGTPVLAKLSPDVTDITGHRRACVDAGADGLSVINTLLGMVIDTDTLRPALAGVTGGLSGPAIRPVAVRCVYQVHAALPDVPILGMGGIRTGLDALQFVLAGASAVSVGTTVFGDPTAPVRVLAELEQALGERGIDRLADAVGLAHPPPVVRLPEGPDPVGDPAPGGSGSRASTVPGLEPATWPAPASALQEQP